MPMDSVCCGSPAVTERSDLTARGHRRFRCRGCGKLFNERSRGVLNRTCLPSDVIAFVGFCRLRYRLTLRDLERDPPAAGVHGQPRNRPDMGSEAAARHGRRAA